MLDLFSVKVANAASVDTFVRNVNQLIINPIIYVLFALAIVFFLFGVLQFLLNQDNEEKKTEGKRHMLWGIVGIVIMLGVFTIMNLILKTFNIDYIKVNTDGGTSVGPLPEIKVKN